MSPLTDAQRQHLLTTINEALENAESYFDNKADGEYDAGGFQPNTELVHLTEIHQAQEALINLFPNQPIHDTH